MLNCAVIGAGLAGRLIAWQLLRSGHGVTLFEQDSATGFKSAAKIAAAMLAPYSELVNSEISVFQWGMAGLKIWPKWFALLEQDCGKPCYWQQQGSIVVAHSQDEYDLQQFYRQLRYKLQQHHLADNNVKLLSRDALQQLEPELANQFDHGIFLTDEACIDNRTLLENLLLAINYLGGYCNFETTVESIDQQNVISTKGMFSFDKIIDCRGFGAKSQLKKLRGVRGEVIWVEAPEVSLHRPIRLMHPRYQLYIAPKPNNVYVIGATEIESESLAPMTLRSSLELQSGLYSLHRGFAEAQILGTYANCRPAFIDNKPKIIQQADTINVNGLYRHGYLLAPVVVNAALNLVNHSSADTNLVETIND